MVQECFINIDLHKKKSRWKTEEKTEEEENSVFSVFKM